MDFSEPVFTEATAHVTTDASAYTELLFSDVFSFAAPKQGSLQVRQAYAVIGDRNVTPFYVCIGKKTIGCGDFSTLSPSNPRRHVPRPRLTR